MLLLFGAIFASVDFRLGLRDNQLPICDGLVKEAHNWHVRVQAEQSRIEAEEEAAEKASRWRALRCQQSIRDPWVRARPGTSQYNVDQVQVPWFPMPVARHDG